MTGLIRAAVFAIMLVTGYAGMVAPAAAQEAGDILVRLRGIGVIPTGDGNGILPGFPTSGLEAKPGGVPELDLTYLITENIGVELIAAISPHDIKATGALSNLGEVADAYLLPPTLLLQYHFFPKESFRPYVGAGINYTHNFLEDAKAPLDNALGPTDVTLTDSVGWAVQAGIDIALNDNWFLNLDVKYIDIGVEAKLKSPGITRTIDVDIDPIIIGFGIGYRF